MRSSRLFAAVAAALVALRCTPDPTTEPPGPAVTRPSGLVVQELSGGRGEAAADGDYVALHYDARITAVAGVARQEPAYDSTRQGEPFLAKLGKTPLLPGFAEGVLGMREGGRRRLTIPPALAYGAIGKGAVPPDATLEYDVELVDRFTRTESGLQYRCVQEGRGAPPALGDRVVVNYRMWLLETGRELASSRMAGRALECELGKADLLPGLVEALLLMRPGARFLVALSPALAYGPIGQPPQLLPGQDVLVDVEFTGTRTR